MHIGIAIANKATYTERQITTYSMPQYSSFPIIWWSNDDAKGIHKIPFS